MLKELHKETFGTSAPMIDPEQGFWWLGTRPDGGAVCFAGMEPSLSFAFAGYMCRAGVLRSYRGRGLQMRLIRARERKARSLKWTLMRSDTTNNIPSANTLIRAGYRLYQPAVPYSFPDTLYWRKFL